MNTPTPPGRVCERESCARPGPESLGTRPRGLCSRNCRQRSYEERRQREAVIEAAAAAAAAATAAVLRVRL
ncbi:hypothetical protein ACFC0M_40420 [Streptomyces sp. NPDC056149]|uniref:hypothetical protein n=1 Tax=Streptomyces sp. NPDC056149 TaxID=3345728 RepID=UPI0035D679B1